MSKKVVVEGEAKAKDGTGVSIEFYEEMFILDGIETEGEARCVIQNGLIADRLKKTIKGYRGWRTCQIIEFKNTQEKSDSSELDALLLEATRLECIPENIENYRRKDFKAKALKVAIEKAKARKKRAKSKKSNVEDQGYVD